MSTFRLRALTVHQPYAGAFFTGMKRYESRNFRTALGPLGIVAAKSGEPPHGLIGVVSVTAMHTLENFPDRLPSLCFHPRKWYWRTGYNVPLYTPMPVTGFQGVRTITLDEDLFWTHVGVYDYDMSDLFELGGIE